ncbi:hypothetical protein B0H17DRAFT_1144742 [Mycena rosella]|uniref:Uncharacterized protein n=1 Tax=Mycena rosella TaxID=1033263 RepID=A0AAD7CS98_MYCRO|nr:hypothetical protein B0H17DRAFT_1144742 [Mycena rosella]
MLEDLGAHPSYDFSGLTRTSSPDYHRTILRLSTSSKSRQFFKKELSARASPPSDLTLSARGADDTLRPVMGWWIFVKQEDGLEKRAKAASGRRSGRGRGTRF